MNQESHLLLLTRFVVKLLRKNKYSGYGTNKFRPLVELKSLVKDLT